MKIKLLTDSKTSPHVINIFKLNFNLPLLISVDDNRISLTHMPLHPDCQRDYINASYINVRILY